jgi:predicted membrane channel-forming protein YqfA (hemolysin III family)
MRRLLWSAQPIYEREPLLLTNQTTNAHVRHIANIAEEHPSFLKCMEIVLINLQTDGFHAWSHVIAATMFAAFSILRSTSDLFNTSGFSGAMATVACVVYTLMFTASALYHISVPNRKLSSFFLDLDYSMIAVSFSTSVVTDIAVAYRNHILPPWQCWTDFLIAPGVMVLFFLLRPSGVFGVGGSEDSPTLVIHTRLSLNVTILLSWILISAALVRNVIVPGGWLLFYAYVFGTVVLLISRANDYLEFTTTWFLKTCPCKPHAIFHLACIVSAIILVAAREYVLFLYK